jgi:D-alanyl-D-alanine carboxypeptidase/D-alanyl-D-alanine-endopeptidase (penicillin-binding protein 4)
MLRHSGLFLVIFFMQNQAFATHLNLKDFQARMHTHLASLTEKTTASIHMEVLGTGQGVFSHNSDIDLVPASASKLMTTSAALEKMGPDYTFLTQAVLHDEKLILIGNGDPLFLSEQLYTMARQVSANGVRHIASVKVNNSAYTQDYDGLARFDGKSETYAGVISPTSLNYNVVQIQITPSRGSKAPNIDVGPRNNGYAIIHNRVRQVKGKKTRVSLRSLGMLGDQEIFDVAGTIGSKSRTANVYAAVKNPESHIAYAFAALLREQGVTVDRDYGGASFAPMDPGGRVIASNLSYPFRDIAKIYMTVSNNFMAEQVFQAVGSATMGGPSSIAKSQQAAKEYMQKIGGCQDASMENGSGLTWNNHISARCFIEALQSVHRDGSLYGHLVNSLPIGGRTGTLKHRFGRLGKGFVAAKVHAKTGTMWSRVAATSLVGITQIASGEIVAFALVENDLRNKPSILRGLKAWEDRAVELIQYLKLN